MVQERKTSVASQGTLRDILTVIEKKIRNLEKRKTRLEQVEKDLEVGKEVNENQRAALSKKDQVLEILGVCREFLQTGEQLAKNEETVARARAKKEQREANQRTIDTIGKVMRLQFLLGEALRREESEDNNHALEALRQSVEEAGTKDFGKVAELWLNVLDAKPKEFAEGVTFEAVHEKLSSMGELLANVNDLSACSDGVENADEGQNTPFQSGTNTNRCDSPLSAESVISDTKPTASSTIEVHQQNSEQSLAMPHNMGSAGDQHPPQTPEQPNSFGPNLQEQPSHDQQMAPMHHPAASAIPAVHHHHPAAILLKGKKGGQDMFCTVAFYSHTPIDDYRYLLPPRQLVPPIPQVINHQNPHPVSHPGPAHHPTTNHGHHPSHGGLMAVLPSVSVVPVSAVQQLQPLKEENSIQFGSVENAVSSQSQHHAQPPHDVNETSCRTATLNRRAGTADMTADLDSMFGDREFDFFQDDQVPSTSSAATLTTSPPASYNEDTFESDEELQPLIYIDNKNQPLDKQKGAIDENFKLLLQIMHPSKATQQAENTPATDDRLQQQHQQQNGTTEEEEQQDDTSSQLRVAEQQQHPQHGYMTRENRRYPRDNGSRGDQHHHNHPHHHHHHQQQQQQTLLHSSSKGNTYYRGANSGGGGGSNRSNRNGPRGGHYGGESSGRNNWSDNRRGGDSSNGNNSNSRGGNSAWNGRTGRGGYSNGSRHHHGGGNNSASGYGNRNGAMMTGTA